MHVDESTRRKQVWDSMLTARLSAIYYQLTIGTLTRWSLFGNVVLVIVLLATVSIVSAYPGSWLAIVGVGVPPGLAAVIEIFAVKTRKAEARRLYEKWSDLSHDFQDLWDRVNVLKPEWDAVYETCVRLDERKRAIRAEESDAPNRDRVVRAERVLYEDMGLPFD